MKIVNNYNISSNKNLSFKSLKLSYEVQKYMETNRVKFPLTHFIEAGKRLENTQYYDLLVLNNMKMRIKEKGNVFSAITEPISISRNGKTIKVTGVYDGIDNELHKKGDNIEYTMQYEDEDFAKTVTTKANKLRNILRLSYITKLMDDDAIHKYSEKNNFATKSDIIDYIIFRYGDIVK